MLKELKRDKPKRDKRCSCEPVIENGLDTGAYFISSSCSLHGKGSPWESIPGSIWDVYSKDTQKATVAAMRRKAIERKLGMCCGHGKRFVEGCPVCEIIPTDKFPNLGQPIRY